MITIKQLRDAVIRHEAEFIKDVVKKNGESYFQNIGYENSLEAAKEMIESLRNAADIKDIVDYYLEYGFSSEEAYENIIKVLMAKSTIVSSPK